jgi:hypothetical protein
MSGSGFAFFSNTFQDGVITKVNGVSHYSLTKLGGLAGSATNFTGYAVMTTMPSGSRAVQVAVVAKSNFGNSGNCQLHLSGAHYTDGTPGPTFVQGSKPISDTLTYNDLNGSYRRLSGVFDLKDLGFDPSHDPDFPVIFGIFRKDTIGEAGGLLEILSTEIQFKM